MSSVPTSTVDPVPPQAAPAPALSEEGRIMRKEDVTDNRALIDLSVRTPVLLFFGSSILWLLLASALGAVSALKVSFPDILPDIAWLTVGRVHPAAGNAFVYGWAGTACIGAALWLMARLCRTPFHFRGTLESACVLWNLGVFLGVFAILYGQGTSYLGLEFPHWVSPILFTAFVLIAFWVGMSFRNRAQGEIYISQWYLMAAFLFFPWTYATANLLCFFIPVEAPAQAVIAAWYAHSLVSLFFVPVALAIAYYIVPKVLGVAIANYPLAKVGFWTWLVFAGWSGAYSLIGGPIPTWMSSLAITASVLTLLPLYTMFVNFRDTLAGRYGALRHVPSLRFATVGVWCFLVVGTAGALSGFRGINSLVHFTLLTEAAGQLVMYGFVSMTLFGVIYYATSRLLGLEWESPALIRAHFWFSVIGFGLATLSLTIGGIIQGFALNDPKVTSLVLLSFMKPFLFMQLVGAFLTGVGAVFLTASFGLMLARIGQPTLVVPLRILGEALAPGRFPSTTKPTPNNVSGAAIASVK